MIEALLWLVVKLFVFALIMFILWWGVQQMPDSAAGFPIKKVAMAILVLVVMIVLIYFLLEVFNMGPPLRLPR